MESSRSRLWVFTVALLAVGHARASSDVADVHKKLREIDVARMKGQVDTLRLKFQEQVKGKPSDPMARVYLAWCDMPADSAWNALKGVATFYPENLWAHQGMGRIYLKWKMRDQAEGAFRTALKVNPKFYPALWGLAEVARAGGKKEEAKKLYEQARALADDAEVRGGLGLLLLELGQVDAARAELIRAAELWPGQPEVLAALARLYRTQDRAKALRYVTLLSDLAPKDKEIRKLSGDLRFEIGEALGAAEEYERFLRLGGSDVEVVTRLVSIYRKANKPELEEKAVARLSALEANNPEHPLRLGELADARGAVEDADAYMLEAAERAPERADVQLKVARFRLKRDQVSEAIAAYRAAKALGGPEAEEAAREEAELVARLKLPPKPASGSIDRIYAQVSASLQAFFRERLEERPELNGFLKLRTRVDAKGKVIAVEWLEDTVGDALTAAHVYLALQQAEYPKQKREPIFEFELRQKRAK